MPTRAELAVQVNHLYREYANTTYYPPRFGRVKNETLLKLIHLHGVYARPAFVSRPPKPTMQVLRDEAYDEYKHRMERFFIRAGAGISARELSVPQTEIVANFLAGIKHPYHRSYRCNYQRVAPRQQAWERRLTATLEKFACADVFPVRLAGICKEDRRRIADFVAGHTVGQRIRPPLPKQKKLFLDNYYQYRKRAQDFFDRAAFPIPVERLTLPQIEALLNFMVGRKHPKKSMYEKVFSANARRPVDYFIAMYKPYENPCYPISSGQYHGRKDEIVPLLFFKPGDTVERWFPPPASTKIKAGRRRLFLNYRVLFERLGVPVAPERLPIAFIEAVINYALAMAVEPTVEKTKPSFRRAG
jgi:hypothetical protein